MVHIPVNRIAQAQYLNRPRGGLEAVISLRCRERVMHQTAHHLAQECRPVRNMRMFLWGVGRFLEGVAAEDF